MLRRLPVQKATRGFSSSARSSKWKRRLLATTGILGTGAATAFGFSYTSEKRRQEVEKRIRTGPVEWLFLVARTVEEKPIPTRQQQLKRLASGEEFDVLVVGGGATGGLEIAHWSWFKVLAWRWKRSCGA